jgi:hypothetical protein
VTASFLKELLRRSVLAAVEESAGETTVTARHTTAALDDLLHTSQQLTRSLLGVGTDRDNPPPGAPGSLPPHRGALHGWIGGAR